MLTRYIDPHGLSYITFMLVISSTQEYEQSHSRSGMYLKSLSHYNDPISFSSARQSLVTKIFGLAKRLVKCSPLTIMVQAVFAQHVIDYPLQLSCSQCQTPSHTPLSPESSPSPITPPPHPSRSPRSLLKPMSQCMILRQNSLSSH